MHLWWLCIGLLVTSPVVKANAFELLANGYSLFVSGGRLLHDISGGMGLLSKMLRAFDSFLDYSAEEQITEALEDEGPDEIGTPSSEEAQSSTTSSSPPSSPEGSFKGCGALGLQITDASLPVDDLTRCCTTHDSCYASSCNSNKRNCDKDLSRCLKDSCDDLILPRQVQKNCQGAVKLLYSGTMALSTQQYNEAQSSLSCRKREGKKGRR